MCYSREPTVPSDSKSSRLSRREVFTESVDDPVNFVFNLQEPLNLMMGFFSVLLRLLGQHYRQFFHWKVLLVSRFWVLGVLPLRLVHFGKQFLIRLD